MHLSGKKANEQSLQRPVQKNPECYGMQAIQGLPTALCHLIKSLT